MSRVTSASTKFMYHYIFPAAGGLFVAYLYNVVDGIFVGQGVGFAAQRQLISVVIYHLCGGYGRYGA